MNPKYCPVASCLLEIVGNMRVVGKRKTDSCDIAVGKRDNFITAQGMLGKVNR